MAYLTPKKTVALYRNRTIYNSEADAKSAMTRTNPSLVLLRYRDDGEYKNTILFI